MKGTLPNFFIVGAAKAGTTSLQHYLNQHPDIFFPNNKENFFFSGLKKNDFKGPRSDYAEVITENIEEYMGLYEKALGVKAVGEACVAYLYYFTQSINNFKKYLNANLKIIIVLRNPIDRAYSNYKHHVRDGIEQLEFEDAIVQSIATQRMNEKWWWGFNYIEPGFYYKPVKAYLNTFGKKNVKIYLYDDFQENPILILKDIFNFLGVDNKFEPDVTVSFNVSDLIINKKFNNFLFDINHPLKEFIRPVFINLLGNEVTEKIVNFFKNKNKRKLKRKTRKKLIEVYKKDLLLLQSLIEKDLSSWLE